MYVPHFNALDDADEIRALVTTVGSAQLVTVGEDGCPLATLLPVISFYLSGAAVVLTIVALCMPAKPPRREEPVEP